MTRETFDEELKRLETEFQKGKTELYNTFARANSTVKIGDIVTDHSGSIRVTEIKVYRSALSKYPECYYNGQPLKKDGTETKKKEIRSVFQ